MNRILQKQQLAMESGEFRKEIRVEEKLLASGFWKVIFRFYLIGEKGAAQFVFHITTKHPEEAQSFYQGEWEGFQWMGMDVITPSGGLVMATDLGFHSREEDEFATHFENCEVLGGECWYDGSTLLAYEVMTKFIKQRNFQVIWDELLEFYESQTTSKT